MEQQKNQPTVYRMSGSAVMGDVELGEDVSLWYNAVVRGDTGPVRIGARTNIQDNSVVHSDGSITIGRGVTVGHACVLHGCRIGDNVLVGMGSILLDDAVIGDDCIIGAGSLVTGGTHIPPGHLAFGRPAKVVRPLTQEEIAHNTASAGNYILLAQQAIP